MDSFNLRIEYSWNVSINHHKVGEMFIVCGVLYAVDSVTERTTKIRLALDLYREVLLDVNLSFSNPFKKTTTVGYNHRNTVSTCNLICFLHRILEWKDIFYTLFLLGTLHLGQRKSVNLSHSLPQNGLQQYVQRENRWWTWWVLQDWFSGLWRWMINTFLTKILTIIQILVLRSSNYQKINKC